MLHEEERALQAWQKAIEEEPANPGIRLNRSIALIRLKRFPEAVDEIDRAIHLVPDEHEYKIHKAHIYERMGQTEEAAAVIEDVLRKSPDNLHALQHYAQELTDLGRYQDAAAAIERVLGAKPDDPTYLNLLGITLDHLDRKDESLVAYTRAIALDAEDALYRINRASLLVKVGRDGEAGEDLAWLLQPTRLAQFREKYARTAADHPYFEPLRSHPTHSATFKHLVGADEWLADDPGGIDAT